MSIHNATSCDASAHDARRRSTAMISKPAPSESHAASRLGAVPHASIADASRPRRRRNGAPPARSRGRHNPATSDPDTLVIYGDATLVIAAAVPLAVAPMATRRGREPTTATATTHPLAAGTRGAQRLRRPLRAAYPDTTPDQPAAHGSRASTKAEASRAATPMAPSAPTPSPTSATRLAAVAITPPSPSLAGS